MATVPQTPLDAMSEGVPTDPKALLGMKLPPPETDPGNKQQDPTGTKIEGWLLQKWEDLRTAYTVYHQICWQNFLYYAGQLWILWDKDRRLWYPAIPEDEYTPQPVINEFAPAIDSITSVFKIPSVESSPKVEDNEDAHEIAEIANVIAAEFIRENGMENGGTTDNHDGVGDRAGQLFTLAGNFFSIVRKKKVGAGEQPVIETVPMMQVNCLDCGLSDKLPPDHPSLQPPPPAPSDMLMGQQVQPPPPSPCPQCGGNNVQTTPTTTTRQATDPLTGKPSTTPVLRWTAECCVGNPLFALPRPGAITFKGCGYCVWAERMSLDDIYRKWEFEAQPDNQYLDSMEASWEISMNYYFTGYSNLTLATKESALVLIVYIEPDYVKDVPEGGVAVMVNNKVINYATWQDACPVGHQLTHFGYLNMPTTLFYRTPAFDMAQVQKELNRYESLIALHGMTSASDSLIIDENTKVSNITGRGDRIVYWRSIGPGSKEPHRLQHGSLDNGIYEQRQRLRDALQQISGAVAVWRGQQTGSVTSAAGISQLRGQAEQMFSKPVDNWNAGWVETVSKGVKLKQLIMQPWEIAAITGPGRDVAIQKFKQADLGAILQWTSTSKGLPKSRDEKRQDLLAMYDRKMLDISDPNVKTRIVELFGETGLDKEFNLDATRARWENSQLTQGKPVQFMPDVEDLEVHLYIHGQRIKRLDFDQLDPEMQKALLDHFMETKMAFEQLALQNAESQVEYKAAAIGKEAPIEPKPGTLLGGGPDAPPSAGAGGPPNPASGQPPAPKGKRGGRVDGGNGGGRGSRTPVASGQQVVPTGPAPRGK